MQQFFALTVASAVLFIAGLFAGQGVNPSDEALTIVDAERSIAAADAPLENSEGSSAIDVPEETVEKPMPSPIMNASHQQQEEVTDRHFFSSLNADTDDVRAGEIVPKQETELASPTVSVNPEARRQLESLIRRMFPEARPDTVSVWADAYNGMDLGEVEFILEQKRALSGTLDSEIATAMLGTPLTTTSAELLLSPQSMSPIVEAQNAIRLNLQCAWSPGFRRMVVLPEAISDQNLPDFVSTAPRQVRMFRSFEPGRMQPSPVPTHVAIGSSDGALMFCLDGDLFTRRGDFQRLEDGRLGLVTSVGCFALKDSTPIPELTSKIRVTPIGEIIYEADGESILAGHVGIVRLSELNRLKTVDGVLFSGETLPASPITASEAELITHRLELSNVDRSDDNQLLELLNTELP